ncbi:hypothetical protein [uncultured Pluralibacter sp.]|uniref:hypothetical protein n=1 Tax=uncultured Pluralibacter sp. TaxID=1490864 RepID=UPI00262D2736|nr:hypothetical protein [uncultured Pluralibacter sp.]
MDTPVRRHRLILLTACLLSALALSRVACASGASTAADLNILRQAENLDLNGSSLAARKMYDIYERKHPDDTPTVPSAINLYALNRLDQVWGYFTQIQKNGTNSDREYASLWLALLYTKDKGKLPAGKERQQLLPDIFITPARREIARLYREELSLQKFTDFINTTSAFAQRDELTEIIFFTAGYIKYVMKDPAQAEKLIANNKSKLFAGSLERPLMEIGLP